MAKAKYNLIIVPEGAVIPEDLQSRVKSGTDVIEKIAFGVEPGVIVSVNTRELQMIVEYRDLFDLECTAIIGLQGAMYSTVWNTYVATMNRATVDNIRALAKEANDVSSQSGAAAVVAPSRADRHARLGMPSLSVRGATPGEEDEDTPRRDEFSDDSST